MKSLYQLLMIVFLTFLLGCQQQQQTLTMNKKETMEQEVKAAFNKLVDAINQKDADTWAQNYSQDQFISACVMTDYFNNRTEWIETVTNYFEMRESQNMTTTDVVVTPLTPTLALLNSIDNTELSSGDGETMNFKHVFTLVWAKEKDGWEIIQSSEAMAPITNE